MRTIGLSFVSRLLGVVLLFVAFTGCATPLPPPEDSDAAPRVFVPEAFGEEGAAGAIPEESPAPPGTGQTPVIHEGIFDEEAIRAEFLAAAEAALPVFAEMTYDYGMFLPTEGQAAAAVEAIGALGHPASHPCKDMYNYREVLSFCEAVRSGGEADLGIYTFTAGTIRRLSFHCRDGAVYEADLLLEMGPALEPAVPEIAATFALEVFDLSEKGYLFYGADRSPTGHYSYIDGLRVLPLGDDKHAMRRYLEPLGIYHAHNVLTESWSDPADVSYNDVFEMLYHHDMGVFADEVFQEQYSSSILYVKSVPGDIFESVITRYFPISPERLREVAVYDPERSVYRLETLMNPGYSPEWEVVEYWTNGDDSLSLQVDAVSVRHGMDRAASHVLTVRPEPDGSFRYLSNQVEFVTEYEGNFKPFPSYRPRSQK